MARYVSAQLLDFLDLDEISSFLNWKHPYVCILRNSKVMDAGSFSFYFQNGLYGTVNGGLAMAPHRWLGEPTPAHDGTLETYGTCLGN